MHQIFDGLGLTPPDVMLSPKYFTTFRGNQDKFSIVLSLIFSKPLTRIPMRILPMYTHEDIVNHTLEGRWRDIQA